MLTSRSYFCFVGVVVGLNIGKVINLVIGGIVLTEGKIAIGFSRLLF